MPENTVYGVKLSLHCDGAKSKVFKASKIRAGKQKRFRWRAPKGISEWTGQLEGSADGVTTTSEIKLKIVSLGPLEVRIRPEGVDLKQGHILLQADRPLDRVELLAFDNQGEKVIEGSGDLEQGELPGEQLLSFELPEGVELRMVQLKMFDEYTFWTAMNIAAWYIEVAHEEVNFETGSAKIRPSERPKLNKAVKGVRKELRGLKKQLAAYERALKQRVKVEERLFVAGYTDRVGQRGDNQVLSLKRAKAIAEYFKKQLHIPIYYAGFGEDVLAHKTADEVDEVRNRRVLYVLSNSAPKGPEFPGARWRKL